MKLEEQVIIHKQVDDSKDSLEFGTPAKGGSCKIYFDANKPDEAKVKIANIKALRDFANQA